jgi:hypothetical protein
MKSIIQLAAEVDLKLNEIDGAGKLEENQIAVGVMSDDLRRIHTLMSQAVDEVNNLVTKIIEARVAHSQLHTNGAVCGEECKRNIAILNGLLDEHHLASARYEVFNAIFWNSARVEFPDLLTRSNIGIADGFTMYYTTSKKRGIEVELNIIGELLHTMILHGR